MHLHKGNGASRAGDRKRRDGDQAMCAKRNAVQGSREPGLSRSSREAMGGIEKPVKERARERVLTGEEILAIWTASDDLGYPFGPLVRLLLLTGVRREEMAGMRHDEIDLEQRLWTVPAERSKTGAAIRIP